MASLTLATPFPQNSWPPRLLRILRPTCSEFQIGTQTSKWGWVLPWQSRGTSVIGVMSLPTSAPALQDSTFTSRDPSITEHESTLNSNDEQL